MPVSVDPRSFTEPSEDHPHVSSLTALVGGRWTSTVSIDTGEGVRELLRRAFDTGDFAADYSEAERWEKRTAEAIRASCYPHLNAAWFARLAPRTPEFEIAYLAVPAALRRAA